MDTNHKLIKTTESVYMAIYRQHIKDLVPFGSVNYYGGDPFGNPEHGRVYLELGFRGAASPIIARDETWKIDPAHEGVRNDCKVKYFLCVPWPGVAEGT